MNAKLCHCAAYRSGRPANLDDTVVHCRWCCCQYSALAPDSGPELFVTRWQSCCSVLFGLELEAAGIPLQRGDLHVLSSSITCITVAWQAERGFPCMPSACKTISVDPLVKRFSAVLRRNRRLHFEWEVPSALKSGRDYREGATCVDFDFERKTHERYQKL